MKAIKLASVFAVSAVAVAVSSTTFAAEGVFSGEAGLAYKTTDTANTLDGANFAEVEIAMDSGLVYAEVEIATDDNTGNSSVDIEKIYVKQGAVKFGKFDGSLSDGAFSGNDDVLGGVATPAKQAAIRYTVMPGLTVALEGSDATNTDGDTEFGFAASYSVDLDAVTLALSAGSVADDSAYNVSLSTDMGAASFALNYGAGELSGADKSQMTVFASFAPTEMLTLSVEYGNDLEAEKAGVVAIAAYKVDGVKYYIENGSGDYDEYTEIGAKATF